MTAERDRDVHARRLDAEVEALISIEGPMTVGQVISVLTIERDELDLRSFEEGEIRSSLQRLALQNRITSTNEEDHGRRLWRCVGGDEG